MRLFDSHCHLDDKAYQSDRDTALRRARKAGVAAFMVVGIDPATARRAIGLAERHDDVFASVGVHPHDAARCAAGVLDELIEHAAHPKVRAWGETGLDFYRMISPREAQERCFRRQLDIANRLDLPLILHERDSGGRFLQLLRALGRSPLRGVVHCFSGNRRELTAYLDLGLHIGITGIVTHHQRGRTLRELVPLIPEERLLVETDAPYLTPSPERNRFRRNEPAFVRSVLLKLADVRGTAPETLAESIWENTCRLYGLEPRSPYEKRRPS